MNGGERRQGDARNGDRPRARAVVDWDGEAELRAYLRKSDAVFSPVDSQFVAAPMFRSGCLLARKSHLVEYELDETAGRRAFDRALADIDAEPAHPSRPFAAMMPAAHVDTDVHPHDTMLTVVFNAMAIGGARALMRDAIGRLAPGAEADIVMADGRHPTVRPCRVLVRSWAYSAFVRAVRHVVTNGNQGVEDGAARRIDDAATAVVLQEAQGRAVRTMPNGDWAGRTRDELALCEFSQLQGEDALR